MTFATLTLICLVTLAGPVLALPRRIGLPVIIGELAVGLVLGTSLLGWLDASEHTFTFLAEVGFALVMFAAGTHVPVRNTALRSGLARGALRAVAVGALAVGAGCLIACVFDTGHAALYAVVLASSSAAIVMPILTEHPMTARPIVEMLPQIAIADAVCIIALPLVLDPANAPRVALGTVAVAVAAALLFVLLQWLESSGRRVRVHKVSEDRALALELRTLLVALFGIAALAVALHASVMLAGFATGLAVAAWGEPKRVTKQIFALTEGLFGPIFFIWLGASLDLRELVEHPAAIGLGFVLGVAAVLVHSVMVVTRQPFPVAAATASQLGVPVAAAALGGQLGVLQPGEGTAFLLGALVTIAVTTVLSGRLAKLAQEKEDGEQAKSGTLQA
ncbi:MAG: cation:proton antiporter [Propionibacteriaceae bacterium]|nr:cation:proton antiporter [Propionibacteriaceae bacterium]